MTRLCLHVFSTLGAGGPQVRCMQTLPRMGAGWRHELIAMDGHVEALAMLPASVAWQRLATPERRSFVASVRAFARLFRERRPDLLLTYNWGAIEALAAGHRLRLRCLHHEDGFGPEEVVRRFRRRNWLRRWLLRRVAVVVPSVRLLDTARREWWLGDNVRHLPNGVDVARFRPAAAPATRPFTIGTVGGLRGEKDHRNLLQALAAMQQPARLLLVGDGPERGRLEALARQLGIAARVEFAGAVADTAPSYLQMDVFVLSSRTEQMPLSMLEAMASGLPVASTDVGDVAIMLPETARAAIVPAADAPALAAALDALAADPERRRREGAQNRARCVERYELAGSLDRFVAAYEAAAGTR